ncbi:helix-turn-helix domain-containing protein [Aliiroseovarius subalbicans]|uniref:helix-turn-helix domain-containing protein n=1 Tax=Aliiroseovarius subalbicans TaxID=2925840 RepID=UPI001F570680|nr:helix-turn-helix domain-containing protein [Aliiroseovarius subalbicans]MCI2398701.1 DUF4115 domain-containing protein [Aliiroseovarius subalbicans]
MIKRWISPKVEEQAEPTGFDSYDLRLGDVMRGERATLGKSLLDVQRELKIKATYIAAIENADPTAFETPGFIAGYVRSYARYLGLDPEWAYDVFCTEAGFVTAHGLSDKASPAKQARKEHVGDPLANPNASFVPQGESVFAGIEPGAIGSVAVLLALIGVIGFGGYSVLQEVQRVDFAPVEQTPGVLDTLPEFEDNATAVADAGGAGLNTPPSADALDRLYRPQALDVPVMVARDGPISTLDPREVGVLAAAPVATTAPRLGAPSNLQASIDAVVADSTTSAVQVLGADAPDVVVFAVRPSWVRVQAADGTVIFEKILESGEQYVLPKTENPPLLRSGNAGSVYFAVNGTAYGPAGDGPSVVKNVALSQEALTEAYSVADLAKDRDLATYVAELQLAQ